MKANDLPNDELVKFYVALRDKKLAAKKIADAEAAAMSEKMDRIGAILLQRLHTDGNESVRTIYGTAFKVKKYTANIADKDAIKQQIVETGAWELVTLIPNKEGIRQHIAAHGDLPAGVNWREEIEIQIQRS